MGMSKFVPINLRHTWLLNKDHDHGFGIYYIIKHFTGFPATEGIFYDVVDPRNRIVAACHFNNIYFISTVQILFRVVTDEAEAAPSFILRVCV